MDSPYLHPLFKDMQKEYAEVVQCNRCGFCETVCPTYMATGKETLSPRGRNQALRHILEGKMARPADAQEIFSTCLTCHACTNVCFSQVPVGRLMAHARSIVQNDSKPFLRFSWLFLFLFSHRRVLDAVVKIMFFMKIVGVAQALQKMGVLKLISPELDLAQKVIPRVTLRFGTSGAAADKTNSKIVYFSGCGIYYLYPEADLCGKKLMEKMGFSAVCGKNPCCGLTAQSQGELGAAKKLAKGLMARFKFAEKIVVNDDSCAGFMKTYPDLLFGDEGAKEFADKVKDLAEFVQENKQTFPAHKPNAQKTVTYHDPCQMGNGHKAFLAPREILQSLEGVKFVEMAESNWCCGGAGTYFLKHPELSAEVLDRKLEKIKATGAQIVATQASSCLIHIQHGLNVKGWDKEIKVLHLAQLLNF